MSQPHFHHEPALFLVSSGIGAHQKKAQSELTRMGLASQTKAKAKAE
jgi:hypothetical protein